MAALQKRNAVPLSFARLRHALLPGREGRGTPIATLIEEVARQGRSSDCHRALPKGTIGPSLR